MRRRHIERRYTDRANIKRMVPFKTTSGETRTSLQSVYENIPCRLSQKALATNSQREPFNQIAYETKLFISPEITILQGDTIEVTRGSVTRTYKAGEPFIYRNHQEISLERMERA